MELGDYMPAKRSKGSRQPSARPKTKLVTVASPTVPGAVEHVERVIDRGDVINFLQKKFPREHRAAERIRSAWEIVHGQAGNVMDFDRARGGVLPGSPPLQHALRASGDLLEAKKVLYHEDYRIVMLIAGEGCPISTAAGIVHRRTANRGEIEQVGRQFRAALGRLADHWWGGVHAHEEYRPFAWRDPAMAFAVVAGIIDGGQTAHATARKVVRRD